MIQAKSLPLVMVEVTDPDEIAKIKAQRERVRKNSDWLQAHVPQVYAAASRQVYLRCGPRTVRGRHGTGGCGDGAQGSSGR